MLKKIWQISREYAGIAEAGGVKNVACSLAEGLAEQNYSVTQFIPLYGCVPSEIYDASHEIPRIVARLTCYGIAYKIKFRELFFNKVRIILIHNEIFREKLGVYTYTLEEERKNSEHKRGTGHIDANALNVLFQKAVLLFARLSGDVPDILQCQDAHTALLPAFINANPNLQTLFAQTKIIVTIHNAGAGYHQQFDSIDSAYACTELPYPLLQRGILGQTIEPFLIAANFAQLTTVSPWYANELMDSTNGQSGGLSAAFAEKGIQITGITNGIDFNRYDPTDTKKSGLTHEFNPETPNLDGKYALRSEFIAKLAKKQQQIAGIEQFGFIEDSPDAVYFGYHGRIAHQKGLDILAIAAHTVLKESQSARFIIIGQGDSALEQLHRYNAENFPGTYVFLRGYERTAARTCVAASDFLVLPSVFEPCGLEDFIAQIYGTIPVAHAVGGLQKIINGETGLLYTENSPESLVRILLELCTFKKEKPADYMRLIANGAHSVREHYSWKKVIEAQYLKLYFSSVY